MSAPSPPDRRPLSGAAIILLAVGFNAPYAVLAATYDYPDVLRRPAAEALVLLHQGGAGLIWTWYAFTLSALALVPVAFALSLSRDRIQSRPALAVGAAMIGALAGITQAIGLSRWVFVIPALAESYSAPGASVEARAAAARAFDLLNAYGGVAIGEHLGQLMTALFVGLVSVLLAGEQRRAVAVTGGITALAIAVGAGEGLALALGHPGDVFSLFTIAGFLGLTVWLIGLGIGLMRGR